MSGDLTKEVVQKLSYFLKTNSDIFVWTSIDMLGIDPIVITYKLNVHPEARPIQ